MSATEDQSDKHIWPVRIYYEDTDAGGVVFYANYLKYAERARTELLREKGFESSRMLEDHGLFIVVRHVEADYRKPAVLDDGIHIHTSLAGMRNTSFQLRQDALREGTLLCGMLVRMVCVNRTMTPVRIPPVLKQALIS